MNSRNALTFVLLTFSLVWHCSSSTKPLGDHEYNYIAYDSTGRPIVFGWIKIDISDSSLVTGSWYIKKYRTSINTSHTIGDGTLRGTLKNDKIDIDLNPGRIDDNTVLDGKFDKDEITGKWNRISFPGITEQGSFIAN